MAYYDQSPYKVCHLLGHQTCENFSSPGTTGLPEITATGHQNRTTLRTWTHHTYKENNQMQHDSTTDLVYTNGLKFSALISFQSTLFIPLGLEAVDQVAI
jgi:hypothetical protein